MTKQEIIAKMQMASTMLVDVRYYGQLEDEEVTELSRIIREVQKLEDYFQKVM